MAAGDAALPNPLADSTLARRPYDPNFEGTSGQFLNKFTIPVGGFEEEATGHSYAIVRLTKKGNRALFDLCHNEIQKEVWAFPSYEFVVRVGSLSVKQLQTARPSYVNAILIASRGVKVREPCKHNSRWVFGEQVRIPGYWNGCCAGCKWKDGGAKCTYFDPYELKYVPASVAPLPRTVLEELED
ncbi:hypothetical protein BDV19DRAFT_383652 [Aspergillus venezuelensis]